VCRPRGPAHAKITALRQGEVPVNLQAVEIKAFVPARDFDLSLRFYQALGFRLRWRDDDLAYLHLGACSFLLQRFHVEAHSHNFVMHLLVEDADAWRRHLHEQDIAGRFAVTLGELKDQPWAMREFSIIDPSGVLWLVAHNLPRTGAEPDR
jgi:catechol 2,3-dioxygenase-like lactoylglutathione lyase family enzyme